ncbi:hypothetical protein [Cohnella silvisoli]|uniref:Uncharacterized protein n=1 Tax=Cohnella silvisoli TaxID=2873699 RepID=A0ABV1KT70_9BACL|nr:hypothetical protein [Cohnella silvisoli]MCD9021444.1 hypothetical protein [Cohnella silvisoli]
MKTSYYLTVSQLEVFLHDSIKNNNKTLYHAFTYPDIISFMRQLTNMLVSQHMAYAIQNPHEIHEFESISDHMLHFFVSVIGLSEQSANAYIEEFFAQPMFSAVMKGG